MCLSSVAPGAPSTLDQTKPDVSNVYIIGEDEKPSVSDPLIISIDSLYTLHTNSKGNVW